MTYTATITGIVGYPTRPKGLRMWSAANKDQWYRCYDTYRGHFEYTRRKQSRDTEAEWFLVFSDGNEIPLPDLPTISEKNRELQSTIDGITDKFWSDTLNLPK